MKRASNAPIDVQCDMFTGIDKRTGESLQCRNRAKYDAPTIYGPWAYMCERHFATEANINARTLGYIIS